MTPTGSPVPGTDPTLIFSAQGGFGLHTLRTASPLTFDLLPTGAVYAIRHGATLINQVLPGPAEDGLFRLWLREFTAADLAANVSADQRQTPGSRPLHSLVGAGLPFAVTPSSARWTAARTDGLRVETILELHPQLPAWRWRIEIHNGTTAPRHFDAVHAQDLGLADEAAVRNNEAYTSQYLDFLPVTEPGRGWMLLVRQNQPMQEGCHPWIAFGCTPGAAAFATDGTQIHGVDHRLTRVPLIARVPALPSRRLQYEFAMAGLQSGTVTVAPGATAVVSFVARFQPDHPEASRAPDAGILQETLAGLPWVENPHDRTAGHASAAAAPTATSTDRPTAPASLLTTAPWLHGDEPSVADLAAWFPGGHRHVERTPDGRILSFFTGSQTHVATRAKEARVARPHGHILRSGDGSWIDEGQFGFTAYAAGVFSAQSYVRNSSLARLLPVVRNALDLSRGAGQRVFIRRGGSWRQLGVPSAFVMTPGEVRWIYRVDGDLIEARAWCSSALPAAFLDLRYRSAQPAEFLVTHELALGGNEFENRGHAHLHPLEGWASCRPEPDTFTGSHLPGLEFGLAVADPATLDRVGGDDLVYSDGRTRHGPYLVFQTKPAVRMGIIQFGRTETAPGGATPGALLAAARREYATECTGAVPMSLPLTLRCAATPSVSAVNEILPWFNHNATIHFSAPHGLEQYGGAAWGVRDVCQGSLEWLLAAGHFATARRMLLTVFARQYHGGTLTGTWPQWFMFPPFHPIQQAHSHGDVCLWPLKALCDYVEAANDLGILDAVVPYTDPATFAPADIHETIWRHCDRVLDHAESRFVAGTALVNYGDGDWDDTLQPADPAMRTRMISAWTVGLAFHALRQLTELCRRSGATDRLIRLEALLGRMRTDFAARLMPQGVVAGFMVMEPPSAPRPLLHPSDTVTGIRYRLLPMTRSILAELFTPEEARHHAAIIARELAYPDGVRLMSEPAAYHGGIERLFKRGETAANVGREIGLQYVHAHLRYIEALAKLGDAEALWSALQVVNPVGLGELLPHASPRQSNVYFSSSDADFADRYEATARWPELKTGSVAVRGGWRLYSSGPGLFLHKVRACLLGVRESFDDLILDPVLPRKLDGLSAETVIWGRRVELRYRVVAPSSGVRTVRVNGTSCSVARRVTNPYRTGGVLLARPTLEPLLCAPLNQIEIEL
ncbi:MAG TPA: hypothetical protein VHE61_22475 [Opitutaceae bacterium]|nr:hypothetical protein [Opitutaceae bacterium]